MMDDSIPPSSRSQHQPQHHQHQHPHPPSSSSSSSTIPTTVSSATSSSSSSSAAVFRPRRSDDWQQYRPIIEQLYLNNQLKLRDVKIIMERDHHFVATEKQYKDRLAAWHIRKNIKAKEVHVMIRKQQKRAARGKQTAFRVGGQQVDSKRISRFLRRYGPSWDNNATTTAAAAAAAAATTAPVATTTAAAARARTAANPKSPPGSHTTPEPDTPTDMSCYTPEPEERPTALSPMPEIPSDPREIFPSSPLPHAIWMVGCEAKEKGPSAESECMLGALEPSPLDPIPSHPEIPDDQSLSAATLSPNLTNDTPKQLEDDLPEEDPWSALVSFQDRLLVLHQTLEQSMSDYTSPLDD